MMVFKIRRPFSSSQLKNFVKSKSILGSKRVHLTTPVFIRTISCANPQFSRKQDLEAHKVVHDLSVKTKQIFDEEDQRLRNKQTYVGALQKYVDRAGIYLRGHVEFIGSAMDKMLEYGVEKDLEVYKYLLSILPEERMIARSKWEVEFMHYPKQQQCAIEIMDQMEKHGVCPDNEFGDLLAKRFGIHCHAHKKYRRILYWVPKFKNLNVYPIPEKLTTDPIELAVLALRRMSIDVRTKITVYKTVEVEDHPTEDTFIVSAQCADQHELLASHPNTQTLFVEGAYRVWMKESHQKYFLLRADPDLSKFKHIVRDPDNLKDDPDPFEPTSWWTYTEEERPHDMVPAPSPHEQEEGTILAMAITGTNTKDSAMTWIKYLQNVNPKLRTTPVVFTIQTPGDEVEETMERLAEGPGLKVTVP